MARDRQIYRETYKKGTELADHAVPILQHLKPGLETLGCDLLAYGRIEKADGSVIEYHDLRVYVKRPPG